MVREYEKRMTHYKRMYVTLQVRHVTPHLSPSTPTFPTFSHTASGCTQDDGSEDDLSYMKLYNYGQKVVTNRMYGYLRMRIAQFLTTVHTTPHTIWLSRHGQSEYNVLGKIGGNPPLSRAGEEYARRLGPWVPHHVCVDAEGKTVKARLWTSSLQVTGAIRCNSAQFRRRLCAIL